MRYRRANVPGATYFFTVNLAERKSHLLVEHVDVLSRVGWAPLFVPTRNNAVMHMVGTVVWRNNSVMPLVGKTACPP